jgi:hypothetical protein
MARCAHSALSKGSASRSKHGFPIIDQHPAPTYAPGGVETPDFVIAPNTLFRTETVNGRPSLSRRAMEILDKRAPVRLFVWFAALIFCSAGSLHAEVKTRAMD